jgi:predicted RNase H-like HicB family nuclease
MNEIIFHVTQNETDNSYTASALGYGIHTEADTLKELRTNIKEAVACHFDDTQVAPKIARLHFVHDKVMT